MNVPSFSSPAAPSVLETIGRTPLVRLNHVSAQTGCEIYGKAEYMNPGQSVKDRPALYILKAALARGKIEKGGLIVEGTAGNTGIGLTLVGAVFGLRTLIVIPETQSREKKELLRILGAHVVEVPATAYKNEGHYVHVSRRLAEERAGEESHGVIWANQFDSLDNRQAHIETTAQEIWEQTNGQVDGFVCAVGTGGTLAGVGMGLKERNSSVQIALADPMGAALYHYYTQGALKSEGTSLFEGIGQGRITGNLEGAPIDHAYQISDQEALPFLYACLEHEGLCLGGSSAINIAGAVRLARTMGKGHTIVTVLCDYGMRYKEKLFNPAFLASRSLPVPGWLA